MGVLQEIILLIYHTKIILWDMWLLHELLSTGNHTILFISTELIMIVLMNKILKYTHKTTILQVHYSLNKILEVLFMI